MRKNTFCTLPHAKDMYDAIWPVFIVSKILGLAPFQYQRKPRRHFVQHCGFLIVMRFIVVIGATGYLIKLDKNSNSTISVGWLALQFEIYFRTVLTCVELIVAATNQTLLIRALENIKSIDHRMAALGIKITYKNAQKLSYFQICGITCVFLCKTMLQTFSTIENTSVHYAFDVADYVNTIMLFQYVDMLLLLRQRYIWLNREIKAMETHKRPCGKFPGYQTKLFYVVDTVSMLSNKPVLSPENRIMALGKLHMQLFQTAKLVNRAFGVQLLGTICTRFIVITTQLINTYEMILDSKIGSGTTHVLTAIYLFLHISTVFLITSISENTAAKAKDTGVYLHKLWNANAVLKHKISFCSPQVLHQGLTFTAAGFFTLDYSLVHSIVGAVTTHIIIIIQFDLSR